MINCVTMSSVTATNHQLRSGRRRSWKEGSGIIASTWTLGKPRRWWSTTAGSSLSLSPLPINGTPVDSISYLQDYLPEDLTWSTHTHTHTFRSVRQGSGLTRDGWEGSGSPPRSWRWPLWRACWPSEHLLVCQLHSRPESRAESGQSSPSPALGSALTAGRLHQGLLQQSHQNNYGHFPHQQLPAQAAEVRHSSAAWKPRLKDSQHIQPLTQLYMDNGHLTIHSHNGQYCMDTTSKQQAKV